MSNDDSFSNIAPAIENKPEQTSEKSENAQNSKAAADGAGANIDDLNLDQSLDKDISKEKPSVINPATGALDIDTIINDIIAKEGFGEGKMMYDAKAIHPKNKEYLDEYVDEDDPGFDTYVVNEENFVASCQELARLNAFPDRAIQPDTKHDMAFRERHRKEQLAAKERNKANSKSGAKKLKSNDSALLLKELSKKKKRGEDMDEKEIEQFKKDKAERESINEETENDDTSVSVLPKWVKFPVSNDDFYPAEFDKTIYDCYNLKVVFDREKTGFEETKDFPIVLNSIIAGRYQVVEYLGSAAFSKAIQCYDIHTEQMVCMKIIENNKDYFDQSIDEIKLLRFIISNCDDLDEKNLLKVIDYFYHKEHLIIVTELLRDNLYEYSKYNREVEKKHYFDIPRLQKVTK